MDNYINYSFCGSEYITLTSYITGIKIYTDDNDSMLGLYSLTIVDKNSPPVEYFPNSGPVSLSVEQPQAPIGASTGKIIGKQVTGSALCGIRYDKFNGTGVLSNIDLKWLNLSSGETKWSALSTVRLPESGVYGHQVDEFDVAVKCFSVLYTFNGIYSITLTPVSSIIGGAASPTITCNCGYSWLIILFIVLLALAGYGSYKYSQNRYKE